MAGSGENIKDVLIKIGLATDDNGVLKQMAADATAFGEAAEKAKKKQLEGEKEHNDLLKQKQTEIQKILQQEKDLTEAIEKLAKASAAEVAATKMEQAALSGGKVLPSPFSKGATDDATGKKGGSFFDLSGSSGVIGKILESGPFKAAAAAVVLAEAPKHILGFVTDTVKTMKDVWKETLGGGKEGPWGKAAREFYETIGVQDKSSTTRLEEREANLQKFVSLESQELEIRRHFISEQKSVLDKTLSVFKDSNDILQSRLDAEKKRVGDATEEFGFLTRDKQQTIANIAAQVAKGGIGTLSEEQSDMAKGSSAFREIFREFAKIEGDKQNFNQLIAEPLGLNKKIPGLEQAIKLNADIINNTTIEIKNLDESVERIAASVKDKMEILTKFILSRVKNDLQELERKIRNRE